MNKRRSIVCTPISDPHTDTDFCDFNGLPGKFTVALVDTDSKVVIAGVSIAKMRSAESRIGAAWDGLDAAKRRLLIDCCSGALHGIVLRSSSFSGNELAMAILTAVLILVRYENEELHASITETIFEAGGAHLNATWAPSAGVVFQLCAPEGRRIH
jgi:hypothetical protein